MSDTEPSSEPSILIISQRDRPDGFGRQPAYMSFLEAEETLATVTGADMVSIDASPGDHRVRARRIAGRQLRRLAHSGVALPRTPSIRSGGPRIELPQEHYDVGVFVGFTNWDLPLLERLPEVRHACGHLLAWLPEVWASDLARREARYEAFGLLDSLHIGMDAASGILAGMTPTPVHYVPLAVDTTRFSPGGPEQPRPIDVLGIGRRDPDLHEHLLDWSRKTSRLYIYDTMSGATVPDQTEHRANLGDTYARTNVALTSYAKSNMPEVTRGERELPGRLWEALAAGAHMIGLPPDEDLQRRVIGETVVQEMPSDAAAAVEMIDQLVTGDYRARRVAHTQLALRQHDWAHRWAQIFRLAGIQIPRGIETRIENLSARADSFDHSN